MMVCLGKIIFFVFFDWDIEVVCGGVIFISSFGGGVLGFFKLLVIDCFNVILIFLLIIWVIVLNLNVVEVLLFCLFCFFSIYES